MVTQQDDPIQTHLVKMVHVIYRCDTFPATRNRYYEEGRLERAYQELNQQALDNEKVIVNVVQFCESRPGSDPLTIVLVFTIIAQVVDRKFLERQQSAQRFGVTGGRGVN